MTNKIRTADLLIDYELGDFVFDENSFSTPFTSTERGLQQSLYNTLLIDKGERIYNHDIGMDRMLLQNVINSDKYVQLQARQALSNNPFVSNVLSVQTEVINSETMNIKFSCVLVNGSVIDSEIGYIQNDQIDLLEDS